MPPLPHLYSQPTSPHGQRTAASSLRFPLQNRAFRTTEGLLMMTARFAALLGIFHICLAIAEAQTPIDWPRLTSTTIASGFSSITDVQNAGDGSQRLFIAQQGGMVSSVTPGSTNNPQIFLSLGANVYSADPEQGLLGIAFPPGFASKHYFYAHYTRASDQADVVSRFLTSADNRTANPPVEQVILVIPQPYTNHHGGQIRFGPDGYLYIGKGDGGSEGDPNSLGQATSSLHGKLLRIDVESGVAPYRVPASNPFVGNPAYSPEIWATGLRNPWRFAFDRSTGDLYIADVGQDSWEEVDFQIANSSGGQNYGWSVMEGNHTYKVPQGFNTSVLTAPVAEYPHSYATGYAIIGGAVYRGPSIPRMDGLYFYGDFDTGNIWALKYDGAAWQSQIVGGFPVNISAFGEDEAGNLYLADYYGGAIYQIKDSTVTAPPTFTPAAGAYNNAVSVQLTSEPNATIYYTTDGANPTLASTSVANGGSVAVSRSETLLAMAVKTGLSNSAISTAAYALSVSQVQFSQPQGQYSGPVFVSMTTATSGAEIHYTLDGSAASAASPIYTTPVLVTPPMKLSAIAIRAGFTPSVVNTSTYYLRILENAVISTLAGSGASGLVDGPGATAEFAYPQAICVDPASNLYVTDKYNNAIRKIGPDGYVTTLAGGIASGYVDATGTAAKFNNPFGICLDRNGDLYVTDSTNFAIRKVKMNGEVTTPFPLPGLRWNLLYLNVDAQGTFYFGEGFNVSKLSGGVLTQYGGPWAVDIGLGVDLSSNIYACASYYAINKISPNGTTTLYAGSASVGGGSDGPRAQASFGALDDLCVDVLGNIYATDGNMVRMIRPNGLVSTLAKLPQTVLGICVDGHGTVYATETYYRAIVKITQPNWGKSAPPSGPDSDGDGLSDSAELIAGTSSSDAGSSFKIQKVAPDGSGNEVVSWPSVAGRYYQVQYSSDLVGWQNLGTTHLGTGALLSEKDGTALGLVSQRFYRVVVGQ